MLRSLSTWLYDRDPISPLQFQEPLNAIKSKIAENSRYFEDMIQSYLLENNHRVTLILTPDVELGKKRTAKEAGRLLTTRQTLSEPEIEKLIRRFA